MTATQTPPAPPAEDVVDDDALSKEERAAIALGMKQSELKTVSTKGKDLVAKVADGSSYLVREDGSVALYTLGPCSAEAAAQLGVDFAGEAKDKVEAYRESAAAKA